MSSHNSGTKSGVAKPGVIPNVDILRFSDDEYRIDQYLLATVGSAAEDGVRGFQGSLKEARDNAANDLQRNVYKNYNEFVTISKEISMLESDMLVLRSLLNELKGVNVLLRDESDLNDDDAHDHDHPTLDEQHEARKLALESLYDTLENIDKLLPASDTRVLIRDGTKSTFTELNPTTLKSKQPVHIYLVSDALIVACKKKSMIGGKSKMIVERVLPLDSIISEMKDTNETTNSFKILRHPDIFVYRTESADDRRMFLAVVRKAVDDFATERKRQLEGLGAALSGSKDSIDPMISRGSLAGDEKARLNAIVPPNSIQNELSPLEVKRLMEMPDELDVYIAHREWDEAVDLIVKAKAMLPVRDTPKSSAMRTRIDERIYKLSSLINSDVASPKVTKTQVKIGIGRLLRLGLQDSAREIFLTTRSRVMRTQIRSIKFDGDIKHYVENLAGIVFSILLSTCDWYAAAFKGGDMASAFMRWAKVEIEQYAELFRKQVFQPGISFTTIAECMQITINACRTLRSVGLDLTFLLTDIFQRDLEASIERHARESESLVSAAVQSEKWVLTDESTNDFDVTESAMVVYRCVVEFLNDVSLVMSDDLFTVITTSMYTLFSRYFDRVSSSFDKEHSIKPQVAMLIDLNFIISTFYPTIVAQLKKRFERPVVELETLEESSLKLLGRVRKKFAGDRMTRLFGKDGWDFANMDYSKNGVIPDDVFPTDQVQRLVHELHRVLLIIEPWIPVAPLLTLLIDQVFEKVREGGFWDSACGGSSGSSSSGVGGRRRVGSMGVQMFLLDVQFLLRVFERNVSETANAGANAVTEMAVKMYFEASGDDAAKVDLRDGDFYDERIDALVESVGGVFENFGVSESQDQERES